MGACRWKEGANARRQTSSPQEVPWMNTWIKNRKDWCLVISEIMGFLPINCVYYCPPPTHISSTSLVLDYGPRPICFTILNILPPFTSMVWCLIDRVVACSLQCGFRPYNEVYKGLGRGEDSHRYWLASTPPPPSLCLIHWATVCSYILIIPSRAWQLG